ncbi:hypothetical protein Micbo1qcDRAFT_164792, partial [Microdochium bolleyi]
MVLLERCNNLNCDNTFVKAATCSEPQDKVLQAIWNHATCHVSKEALEQSLYEATDLEKTS